jgi:hypothetical protein
LCNAPPVSEEPLVVSVPVLGASTAHDSLDAIWEGERLSSWARRLFWFFGLTLGLMEGFASRFWMNVDGISYLDMGDAYWKADWSAAINGYWSPFYSWLLGAAIHLFHVTRYWESSVVRAMNFLIFVATMGAFDFFLRELCRHHRGRILPGESSAPLPLWTMQVFGYLLFLQAGLVWISVGNVTPDQCVAGLMYLLAGLLLRIHGGNTGWRWYALLGILLGTGYLMKAILLPLGLVSLAAIPFLNVREGLRGCLARTAVAAVLFALVASPLVIALSLSKGRLTSGDTGKIAYAVMVDRLSRRGQWQGEGNFGTPKHPVPQVWSNPIVYQFATPVGGTYPPWYDGSYWLDGVKTHLDIDGQLDVLKTSVAAYFRMATQQWAFIVVSIILFIGGCRGQSFFRQLGSTWFCWIAAGAGLFLYSLVLVETRYVASFLVIAGLSCLGGIRLLPEARTRRALIALSLAFAAYSLYGLAARATSNLYSSILRPRHEQWDVAQALVQHGLRPGDGVATILDHGRGDYWARLAQVKIVEEIPTYEKWKLSTLSLESRAQLIRILQNPGAKAIITMSPGPPSGTGVRWERLGDTEYFFSSLTRVDLY